VGDHLRDPVKGARAAVLRGAQRTMLIGYARVSTEEQNLDSQRDSAVQCG